MRKTKLFILLTFLLSIGLNSWAADAISCSTYLSGTAGTATTTDCSLAYYSDEGSAGIIPDGSAITVSEVNYHYAKMNDNKNYYVVTLNKTVGGNTYSTFKAGDVITVYLYSYSSTVAYKVGKTAQTSVSLTGQTTSTIITAPHTLTAAEIESNGTIRIYRNSSNTYFAGISVSGSRATEKFTVTFNAGSNGTCGTASLTEASPGAGVTLPAVTPNSGYAFNGWYTAATAGTKVGNAGDTYNPTASIELHAQYIEQVAPGISIDNYTPSTSRGKEITFTATPTGAPAPTVTWYQSATATTSGGTEKGTGATYKPSVEAEGTFYYYAVASNGVSPDATSSLITLTVTNPDIDRSDYNTYYLAKNDQPVGGARVLCDDITMVYDNVTYNTASSDNMINALNANYVASISTSTNGWGVTFTPSLDGVLSVGVIINGGKTFSITNASSFKYNGLQDEGKSGTSANAGTNASGSWTPSKKQYTIITLVVIKNTSYKFSVSGSKMALYGFEFETSVPVTIGSTGWATFCSDYALNFAGTGVSAYLVSGHNGAAIEKSEALETVPAATPLLLNASIAKTYDIPVVASSDDVGDNLLVRGTGEEVGYVASKTRYVLMAKNSTTAEFQLLAENGATATVGTDKAYLEFNEVINLAPAALRLIDEENGATDIMAIDATEEAVKFIENGKLYIKKNNVVYDALGRVVR